MYGFCYKFNIYIYIYLIYKFLVIGDFNAEESARTSTIPTRL